MNPTLIYKLIRRDEGVKGEKKVRSKCVWGKGGGGGGGGGGGKEMPTDMDRS